MNASTRWSRGRRAAWIAVAVTAAAMAGGIGWAVANQDFLLYRFGVVHEHVLYRAKFLDTAALDSVVRDRGIRTIVNLREEDQPGERDVARVRGARYVWLPSTQVPPPDVIAGFLDVMRDPKNHPVLLHCEHGVGRTGALVGVYRLEFEGARVEDVVEEARKFAIQGSFKPGSPKVLFLEEYARRMRDRRAPAR